MKESPEGNESIGDNKGQDHLCYNHTFLFLVTLNLLLIFKNNKKPFFSLFYLSIFIFMLFKFLPKVNNIDENIISCNKRYFFTVESIDIGNAYANLCLKNNFNFFAFSKMKYKSNPLFLKYILLLSGDISLNPGPSQIDSQLNNEEFLPFRERGLHFLHLNINSLLTKIDELRHIANKSKVAVIGISESKLDDTVLDDEVSIDGYNLL